MDDLGLVRGRRLLETTVEVTFPLAPGDRSLVEPGESVVAGAPIAERVRDPRLVDVTLPPQTDPRPGQRIPVGEILFDWHGRWRIAAGEMSEPLETPVAGIIREVRTGSRIVLRAAGRSVHGVVVLGGPTRGRLHTAAGADGELRSGGLDVSLAGRILVTGA